MISCPICAPGWAGRALIEMEASYVVGGSGPSVLPGYTVVVAKRHVREPFALAADELTIWWAECMLVARAIREVFRPVKLNYEIHGNTIEHLHLHMYPRFAGDDFEGRPIDPRAPKRHVTTPEQVDALTSAVVRLRGSV